MAENLLVIESMDVGALFDTDALVEAICDGWSYAPHDETIIVVADEERRLEAIGARLHALVRTLGLRPARTEEIFVPDESPDAYTHLSFTSVAPHTDGHLLTKTTQERMDAVATHWRTLHVVIDGEFSLGVEGCGEVELKTGDVFIMSPMKEHYARVKNRDEDGNEIPVSTLCIETVSTAIDIGVAQADSADTAMQQLMDAALSDVEGWTA